MRSKNPTISGGMTDLEKEIVAKIKDRLDRYVCICGRDTESGPIPVHRTSGHSVTCQHYNWSTRRTP